MLVLSALLAALAVGLSVVLREGLLRARPARLLARNFRGENLPAVGGAVVLGAIVIADAFLTVVASLRPGTLGGAAGAFSPAAIGETFLSHQRIGLLIAAVGFFALGLLDDLIGNSGARGFAGHFRSLKEGQLTGGIVKTAGGAAVALIAAGFWETTAASVFVDALIVALSANLLNLFDLKPGRACKVFFLTWIPLAAVGWYAVYVPVTAPAAAAALVWLPADLGERGMLGDGGSNLLGAVAGSGLALILPGPGKLIALSLLVGATVLAERWSFGAAIDAVAPLRWFDRIGRRD